MEDFKHKHIDYKQTCSVNCAIFTQINAKEGRSSVGLLFHWVLARPYLPAKIYHCKALRLIDGKIDSLIEHYSRNVQIIPKTALQSISELFLTLFSSSMCKSKEERES